MATEKWVAGSGVGLTWTSAFTGSTLNSLASGNALLGLQIDNSSALDLFCDVTVLLASLTPAAPNYVGLYLYPLLSDGSTYGDGRFGTAAAGPPPGNYWVANMGTRVGTAAVASGGTTRIVMPPGSFKFVLYNGMGVAFNATGNTCLYRTYNRQVA